MHFVGRRHGIREVRVQQSPRESHTYRENLLPMDLPPASQAMELRGLHSSARLPGLLETTALIRLPMHCQTLEHHRSSRSSPWLAKVKEEPTWTSVTSVNHQPGQISWKRCKRHMALPYTDPPPPLCHINFLKGINQPRGDMWHPLLWILLSRTFWQERRLKSLDVSQTRTTSYTFETFFGFFHIVNVHILEGFSRSIIYLSRNENAYKSIICEINTCTIAWLQHGLSGDTKTFWKYHVTR